MLTADHHQGNQEDRNGEQFGRGIPKSARQHRGDRHHAWPRMTIDHAWPLTMLDPAWPWFYHVWPCCHRAWSYLTIIHHLHHLFITNSILICDHNHLHFHANLSRVTLHSSTTQARSNTNFTTTATWPRWASHVFEKYEVSPHFVYVKEDNEKISS